MIEIPEGKFVGQPSLDWQEEEKLSEFLFDPRNSSFKAAFEKAAGIKLEQNYGITFFADKREAVEPAKAALEELSKELRLTVEKSKFQRILNKLTP